MVRLFFFLSLALSTSLMRLFVALPRETASASQLQFRLRNTYLTIMAVVWLHHKLGMHCASEECLQDETLHI